MGGKGERDTEVRRNQNRVLGQDKEEKDASRKLLPVNTWVLDLPQSVSLDPNHNTLDTNQHIDLFPLRVEKEQTKKNITHLFVLTR